MSPRAVIIALALLAPASRAVERGNAVFSLEQAIQALPTSDARRELYRATGDRPLFAGPSGLTPWGKTFLEGIDGLESSRFTGAMGPDSLRALVQDSQAGRASWAQVELAFAQSFLALAQAT